MGYSYILAITIALSICALSRNTLAQPTPTPAVNRNADDCPYIRVDGPRLVHKPDAPLKFSARVTSMDPAIKPSFSWQISEGTIVSGQGTNAIAVMLPENTAGKIVAKVSVSGYSPACPTRRTTGIFETVVGVGYLKYEEYEQICEEDEKARLDHFAIELNANPDLVGYVIFYGGRCYSSCEIDYPRHRPHYPRRGETETRAGRIKPFLVEVRGIDADRIFVVNGGFRQSWTAELWLVAKGAQPPPVTPTVNAKDIKYRTGKVTKQELRLGCAATKR